MSDFDDNFDKLSLDDVGDSSAGEGTSGDSASPVDSPSSDSSTFQSSSARLQPTRDNPLDLEGVPPEAAKQYYVDRVTYAKKIEREIADLDEQISKWKDRVQLATERGAEDLAAEARERLQQIEQKRSRLARELQSEQLTNERLRELVQQKMAFNPSVDVAQLSAELQMLTGEEEQQEAEIDEKLAEQQVEDELAAMKKALQRKQREQESEET